METSLPGVVVCIPYPHGFGQPHTQIVVLSLMDKEEMDEAITNRISDRRGSTVIVRKGDAMAQADLLNISCSHARYGWGVLAAYSSL
jgi:hypothetical protein